jgi:hypothetical protein
MVTRWKWLVRKAIERADDSSTIPVPYIPVVTVLMGCAMSQIPWLVLASNRGLGAAPPH